MDHIDIHSEHAYPTKPAKKPVFLMSEMNRNAAPMPENPTKYL